MGRGRYWLKSGLRRREFPDVDLEGFGDGGLVDGLAVSFDPAQRGIAVPAVGWRSTRRSVCRPSRIGHFARGELAADASFGAIETREEPLGGLFYHVNDKTIAATDAPRGVFVIDFGGGICDFAFTFRGKIAKSWGDMYLGGRLLGDLFIRV